MIWFLKSFTAYLLGVRMNKLLARYIYLFIMLDTVIPIVALITTIINGTITAGGNIFLMAPKAITFM